MTGWILFNQEIAERKFLAAIFWVKFLEWIFQGEIPVRWIQDLAGEIPIQEAAGWKCGLKECSSSVVEIVSSRTRGRIGLKLEFNVVKDGLVYKVDHKASAFINRRHLSMNTTILDLDEQRIFN